MGRVIRWIAGLSLTAVALIVLLWTASRVSGPTAEQRHAIVLLERPAPLPGRNAFAALWLLTYDVPEAAIDSVAAADMARFVAQSERRVVPGGEAPAAYPAFTSSAEGRYRNLAPSADDIEMMCGIRQSGCLARVRRNQAAYTALVSRNARLFDRIAALSGYDFIRSPILGRVDLPLPEYSIGSRAMTGHAVAFVTGDKAAAVEATCRAMSTWRRLGNRSDTLIARMIGIAYSTDANGRLLAEMLAELPRGFVVPAACGQALVPMPPSETSLCSALQGEFKFSNAAIEAMVGERRQEGVTSAIQNVAARALFDPEKSRADAAANLAAFCTDEALLRIAADRPPLPRQPGSLVRLDCVANAVGCILHSIGADYAPYAARAQDQAARFQLLGTLLWLRQQPDDGRSLAQKVASRPAALVSPTRPVEISDDGSAIHIRQFDVSRGATWALPLPVFLHDAANGKPAMLPPSA